ncbi:MAG: nucleotidyltransferase family protein [Ruminococcaceae bacterium]|nr:nucleotidyltransferase family protein [Oscillospiraceae bacterium]
MAIIGIIAEFNPLHNGHKALLQAAKAQDNTVVCVISGNFVQRGDTAVIPKLKRAESALRCGADLVAELPVLWSMSTAQNFALGGVSQLMALGCDEIMFGSECGDINELLNAADILQSNDFADILADELKSGVSFANARSEAVKKLGLASPVLSTPNDTLGIEYILAARRLGFEGKFSCFKRIGAAHDSDEINPLSVSASLIREKLKDGNLGFAERFMPIELRNFLHKDFISDFSKLETAILAVLRSRTKEELANLPDISEGLENKLFLSIQRATSFEELCFSIKTKRYSYARIRRIVLAAFLGLDKRFFGIIPPYVRILGFNSNGEKICGGNGNIPVVTRVSEIKKLDETSQAVFSTECKATDLYSLSLFSPQECGAEYKSKLLKTECLT